MTTAYDGDRMAFVATGAPHHPDLTDVAHDDVTETIDAVAFEAPPAEAPPEAPAWPATVHRSPYLAQDLEQRKEYARRFRLLTWAAVFCLPAAILLYGLALGLIALYFGWAP